MFLLIAPCVFKREDSASGNGRRRGFVQCLICCKRLLPTSSLSHQSPSSQSLSLYNLTVKIRRFRKVCKMTFAVNIPHIKFQIESSLYCDLARAGIAPATTEHPIVHNVSKKQTTVVEKNDFLDSDKNDLIEFISPPFFMLVRQLDNK